MVNMLTFMVIFFIGVKSFKNIGINHIRVGQINPIFVVPMQESCVIIARIQTELFPIVVSRTYKL